MTSAIIDLFGNLGWALLHSIWQGTLACVAVVAFRIVTPHTASATRYLFQAFMLALCLVAFATTFSIYHFYGFQTGNEAALGQLLGDVRAVDILGIGAAVAPDSASLDYASFLSRYAPYMGVLWCLGFAALSVRYARRLHATQKLRTTGLSPVPAGLERQLASLLDKVGLRRSVEIFVSDRVNGPLTLGAFKPLILVPASFLTGLHRDEVEAILLHEIAHIHRHDFFVNLTQTAIRSVFFYHPAIGYISRKIDEDREFACDDFAVAATRNPIALARGLASVRLSLAKAEFAMAADGKDSPLMGRLKRLTGQDAARSDQGAFAVPLTAFALVAFALIHFSSALGAEAAPQSEHARYDKQNYRFETIQKDGVSLTVKITEDGRRWILRDGMWLDLVLDPRAADKLQATPVHAGEPPQPPIPPAPPKPPKYKHTGHSADSLAGGSGEWDEAAHDKRMQQFEIDMQYFQAEMARFQDELQAYVETQNEADAERIEARAERLTERATERAERNLERAHEQAERNREHAQEQAERAQERAQENAERERERAGRDYNRHQVFETQLVEQLIEDGYISSSTDDFQVEYSESAMHVNGMKVPEGNRDNYCEIMSDAGLKKANQSHIVMENGGRTFTIHSHGK